MLQDEEFRNTVFDIMDEEIIHRFDKNCEEIKIED
jgi:hypothetical protein